jgi:hypothetical protein
VVDPKYNVARKRPIFRALSRAAALIGVCFALPFAIRALPMNYKSTPVWNDSSNELSGLVLTIRDVQWKDQSELTCSVLLLSGDMHGWALDSFPWVEASFFDGAGEALGSAEEVRLFLDDDFLSRKKTTFEQQIVLPVQSKARYMRVELGQSGLLTNKIKLPARAS